MLPDIQKPYETTDTLLLDTYCEGEVANSQAYNCDDLRARDA